MLYKTIPLAILNYKIYLCLEVKNNQWFFVNNNDMQACAQVYSKILINFRQILYYKQILDSLAYTKHKFLSEASNKLYANGL